MIMIIDKDAKPEREKVAKSITLDNDIWTFIKSMADEERVSLSAWLNGYFLAVMRRLEELEAAAAAESPVNAKR